MAEQTGHNVVEKPQSTSGSPLVDAAANQPTASSADRGTYTRPNANLANDKLNPIKDAAEPSAGDAANQTLEDQAQNFSRDSKLSGGTAPAEVSNGVGDDASEGDGVTDDRSTADISVDASVNSDTENSRAELAEKRDGNHHARTNSVKKPAIFSKVTATKNFMSKVAPTAPIAPKVGDKPSPTAAILQSSSKPRLVAKTGASLANLQKSRLGTETAGGPDASKVWNKNRPAPQPAPRALTDEELKQQYGIHLATRLQSEENGKDSKWADIDDDEEDWAPEAVVWMDGTKSTLTPQDTAPPAPELKGQTAAVPQQSRPSEGVRPTLALKQRSDMKILKPGSAATQAKAAGASTPSAIPDKGALNTKSPAPAPTKSPWAPVPKVESISPIVPPVQQPPAPPRLATQDARAYEPPQPIPAREIATDTFDRSWKESEGGTRELFNSANGRYEPAPEGRRGSAKPDGGLRKPAVLQRPSQSVLSPAEPSAAFQSRTSTQLDGSWGRRRGSSVSQGSLPPGRRLSMNQRPDLPPTVETGLDVSSPVSGRGEYARPGFPQQSAWDRQMPPRPDAGDADASAAEQDEPAEPAEDPVKVQERVMREKRELARKRRQEEEQLAEVAKQERLKAKLAALEGAGKSKKEREAEAAAAAAATAATAVAVAETSTAIPASQEGPPPAPSSSSSSPPPPLAQPPATVHQAPSPPLPPPTVAEKLPASLPSKPPAVASLPDRPLSSEQTHRTAPGQHLSPRANARALYQPPAPPYNKTPATSSYSSPGDRKLQPSAFERSPNLNNDTFTPWPTTAPSRNVWGTAGIGNGTFENSSAFAPVPMPQQNSALPPPPGMARPSPSARISPLGQESRSPSMQQQQISEQQRAYPPPGIEPRSDAFATNQSRLNGISPAPGAGRPHPPGPIGPPSRIQPQSQPPPTQRSDPLSAWGAAAVNLPAKYASEVAAADAKRKQPTEGPVQPSENRYKETYKKTSSEQGKLGAPRRYEATEYTVHDAQGSRSVASLSPAPPATQTQPSASFQSPSPVQDLWRQTADNPVRIPDPSRNPAHGGMPVRQQPTGGLSNPQLASNYQSSIKFPPMPIAPISESKDQSPPPPETDNHPVNLNVDLTHPHVRLPRPQAKVKLPPTSPSTINNMPTPYPPAVMMPPSQRPSTWSPVGANRPLVQNEAWQARFNGLFNRTTVQAETPPSPPKTPPKMQGPLLAVASSSRMAMDEQAAGATVSLPVTKKTVEDADAVVSKPFMDELFREERSFGSIPRVKIPRNTKYNTEPYPSKPHYTNSQLRGRLAVQSSQEPFFWKHSDGIFVAIRGTKLNNKLCRSANGPNSRGKDGLRKPGEQTNEHKGWTERRPGQAEHRATGHGVPNNKDMADAKPVHTRSRAKELSSTKKPGRSKAFGKDDAAAPTPADKTQIAAEDGTKQSTYQKPTRQGQRAPSASKERKSSGGDGRKDDSGVDRKKTGWNNRVPRHGNRTANGTSSATAAAAAAATAAVAATTIPIKSN